MESAICLKDVPGPTIPLPAGLELKQLDGYRVGIHAHHITGSGSSPWDLRIMGTVLLHEVSGSETVLHVQCGTTTLTAQLPGMRRYELHEAVTLHINPRRFLWFDSAGHRLDLAAPTKSNLNPTQQRVVCGKD